MGRTRNTAATGLPPTGLDKELHSQHVLSENHLLVLPRQRCIFEECVYCNVQCQASRARVHDQGLKMMVAANKKICVVENIYKYKVVTSVLTTMV